jgi:hypothetical protein
MRQLVVFAKDDLRFGNELSGAVVDEGGDAAQGTTFLGGGLGKSWSGEIGGSIAVSGQAIRTNQEAVVGRWPAILDCRKRIDCG